MKFRTWSSRKTAGANDLTARKSLAGILKACEKRPVSMIQLEAIADKTEVMVQDSSEREVSTRALGETIMNELKNLDKVAYVRFASVYLDFKDVQEFMSELKGSAEKPANRLIRCFVIRDGTNQQCILNFNRTNAAAQPGLRRSMCASGRRRSSSSSKCRAWIAATFSFPGRTVS